MVVFGLVFVIVAISIAGLAIGILLGRAPLQGTCGTGNSCETVRCAGCPRKTTSGDNV